MRVTPDEWAIARSVLYASLFDYPLTVEQLHQTLIESDQTPSEILATYNSSRALQDVIDYGDGFFFPAGQHKLIAERQRREARSRTFLERHRLFLRMVCAVPFVRMVALSGSIAHLNLERDGDLDLFVVTRGEHVWSVTVAIVMLAKLMGRRNVVCANFVVSDSDLAIEQPDLFTANQIIHLKPLVGCRVFTELLAANAFVKRFYPNFRPSEVPFFSVRNPLARTKRVIERLFSTPSNVIEIICRRAYGWHLRRRSSGWRSPEQVRLRSNYLKLHTQSHRQALLDRFDVTLQRAFDPFEDALKPERAAAGAVRP